MRVMKRFKGMHLGTEGPISVIELEPFPLESWNQSAEQKLAFGRHLAIVGLYENTDWGDDLSRSGGPRLFSLPDMVDLANNKIEVNLTLMVSKYDCVLEDHRTHLLTDPQDDDLQGLPIFEELSHTFWQRARVEWLLWTHWLNLSADGQYSTYGQMPNCDLPCKELLGVERMLRPHNGYTVARLSREASDKEKFQIACKVIEVVEKRFQKAVERQLKDTARRVYRAAADICAQTEKKICSASGIIHP